MKKTPLHYLNPEFNPALIPTLDIAVGNRLSDYKDADGSILPPWRTGTVSE